MPGYVIGNFFVYSVINAFTPGPGNILALNTVTNYGWKKGNPLFLGIFAGYYVVQLICAVFVFGVSAFLPGVLDVMKYVGAAYILWLAVHIAFSRPDGDSGERSASFWKGFMLQFVNVKIYLFGITALTGYVTNYSTALWVLILFELIIATIRNDCYNVLDRSGDGYSENLSPILPANQYHSGLDLAGMCI